MMMCLNTLNFCQWVPLTVLTFFFTLSLSYTHAQPPECTTIVGLYQRSLKQYQDAAQQYLKQGCQESNATERCRALESATREMKSTVEMFAMRGRALKCKANTVSAPPQDPCARLQSMIRRTRQQIDRIRDQQQMRRCSQQRASSICRSLEEALNQPREVKKAILRKAHQQNCQLQE